MIFAHGDGLGGLNETARPFRELAQVHGHFSFVKAPVFAVPAPAAHPVPGLKGKMVARRNLFKTLFASKKAASQKSPEFTEAESNFSRAETLLIETRLTRSKTC
jgi:hypothetical protein